MTTTPRGGPTPEQWLTDQRSNGSPNSGTVVLTERDIQLGNQINEGVEGFAHSAAVDDTGHVEQPGRRAGIAQIGGIGTPHEVTSDGLGHLLRRLRLGELLI
ncbi:MAG: hypothetical protein ACRDTV_22170, partial [Mycobacterium sp.]